MFKFLTVICGILAFPTFISAQTSSAQEEAYVKLTSPSSAEEIQAGSSFRITWEQKNISRISIYRVSVDGDLLGLGDIAVNPADVEGSFEWTVSKYVNTLGYNGFEYKIRINATTADGRYVFDESSGTLKITPYPFEKAYVKVLSPNGGEQWEGGNQYTVTWEQRGLRSIYIGLENNPWGIPDLFPDGIDPSLGRVTITLPEDINLVRNYSQFRVSILGYGEIDSAQDTSDATFEIQPRASVKEEYRNFSKIHLVSTFNGEAFYDGQKVQFLIEQKNLKKVTVELTFAGVPIASGVFETDPSITTGTYEVEMPTNASCVMPDAILRIGIRGQSSHPAGGNVSAQSSGFVIWRSLPDKELKPQVSVVSPNGLEHLHPGDKVSIQWSATDLDTVTLNLLNELNAQKPSLGDNDLIRLNSFAPASQGAFQWIVPDTIPDGRYRIYITGSKAPGCGFMRHSAVDWSNDCFYVSRTKYEPVITPVPYETAPVIKPVLSPVQAVEPEKKIEQLPTQPILPQAIKEKVPVKESKSIKMNSKAKSKRVIKRPKKVLKRLKKIRPQKSPKRPIIGIIAT